MKNIVMIVLDSMSYNDYEILKKKHVVPFLKSLEDQSLSAVNVYSEGPHTEVGMRSLICGCDTLDYGGSCRCLVNNRTTIFDEMLKNDIAVKYIATPATYVDSNLYHNKDFECVYTLIYKFVNNWGNKFNYWADMYKKQDLNNAEKELVISLCEDAINVCSIFWNELRDNKRSASMIEGNCINADVDKILQIVRQEEKKFVADKWVYVETLLNDFENNPLVIATDIDEASAVDIQFIDKVKREQQLFLNEIKKCQIKNNSAFRSWKLLINAFLKILRYQLQHKCRIQDIKKNIVNYQIETEELAGLFNWKIRRECVHDFELNLKDVKYKIPSFKKQLNFVLGDLLEQKQELKRQFYYLQPEELHYEHNWFSWDIKDIDNANEEFNKIKKRIELAKDLPGHMSSVLAFAYVDICLETFFEKLKDEGLDKDTMVIITSDHGSSYGVLPVRDAKLFNNFYLENYHIPCIITNVDEQYRKKYDGLYNSTDVMATVLKLVGVEHSDIKGKSIMDFPEGRDIVHSEYMGPGFQDVYNKRIWFSAHDTQYKVNYIVGLDNFENGHIEGIYNLEKDPYEKKNLVKKKYDHAKVEELLGYLKKRWNDIRKQYI